MGYDGGCRQMILSQETHLLLYLGSLQTRRGARGQTKSVRVPPVSMQVPQVVGFFGIEALSTEASQARRDSYCNSSIRPVSLDPA